MVISWDIMGFHGDFNGTLHINGWVIAGISGISG